MTTGEAAALTVRPLAAEEWDGWYRRLEIAFGGEEEEAEERALYRSLTEVHRALVVCDGAEPVGGGGAFSFRMAVPGGAVLPVAGVTMVGVLPTHRRRGGLSVLMRRLLDDVRAAREPLAALTASEPGIYGRFGFGAAAWRTAVTVPCHRVSLPVADNPALRLRLADPVEASPACEELYASLVPLRPGRLERRPGWERHPLLDVPSSRGGYSPRQCVLAEDTESGRLLGYARYSSKVSWTEAGNAAGRVKVQDIEAVTPQVYARLWRYLIDMDLVDIVEAGNLPVDDPLLHLVSDVRRLEARLADSLHLRLVDVGAALESRGYAQPVDAVLEVVDGFCPWNTGRWRLRSAGPGRATSCVRTGAPADLVLDVRELGAAYLGGATLAALAGAGLVTELRAGALAQVSRAFASDVAPWLPHGF
ncbi:GNAT family N-acetyltransferase [Kitasatospora sp. NPDC051914]|uniref:GNAT family N-acetyltransferase n=1 Tax=Kitasatospora sp. NPDC051914 TaxID=3154945 RepID=UPI0034423807